MKRIKLLAVLFFSCCLCLSCDFNHDDDGNDEVESVTDAELIELYGGVYKITGTDISIDYEAKPEVEVNEDQLREYFSSDYEIEAADEVKLYLYLDEDDIVDGKLDTGDDNASKMSLLASGSAEGNNADEGNLIYNPDAEITTEIDDSRFLVELGQLEIDSGDSSCDISGNNEIELIVDPSRSYTDTMRFSLEYSMSGTRTICGSLTWFLMQVTYHLERTAGNEDAYNYFYPGDAT